MRTVSRRQVLRGGAAIAGAQLVAPLVFRAGQAAAFTPPDPATQNRLRLVLIDLFGGNDGLNTVVPQSGTMRAVYDKVRPTVNIPTSALTLTTLGPTNGGVVALNPYLKTVKSLWDSGRVAIVQGADYPNHDYSHFVSDDVWQSGEPGQAPDSGWLGRHLDRVRVGTGELRGVGIGYDRLPLALRGLTVLGEEINSLGETQFTDGGQTGVAGLRHKAYAGYDAAPDPVEHYYGSRCRGALDLAEATAGLSTVAPGGISNALMTARTLLTKNLGVEVVVIGSGGYDTHDNQLARHQALMTDLDLGIETFLFGTRNGNPVLNGVTPIGPLDPQVAARTLIMTFSEFGRRIGDNANGTDHGAAGPMFLVGPPPPAPGSGAVTLVPGLHGDHPDMGSTTLPADNLGMTTDIRTVYQAVLQNWLNDPTGPYQDEGDPLFTTVSGTGVDSQGALTGLFGVA
ncbi:MAG TPA: hypothetical protein VFQ85_12280 [Mycobacteriales bacterium]|jgi:uncharacterized protein (DUF1501 family)|nr:hypothetical protein [Mycobacteriales bacterium]